MSEIRTYLDDVHRRQVTQLWGQVFGHEAPHNAPPFVIDKKLAMRDDLFFVAMAEESVVGTILAGYDGHRGWLYSVAVSPTHRKKGIGSALVRHAERELTGRGCIKINLQIVHGNEGVAAFYESLGYMVEKRVSMGKRINEKVTIT